MSLQSRLKSTAGLVTNQTLTYSQPVTEVSLIGIHAISESFVWPKLSLSLTPRAHL